MLAAVPAVRQLLPGLLRNERPSVACVYTTRPKYLVFDGSSEQPACVVEFGETERLAAVQKVLAELSPRLPQTVPATLRCAHWREGTSVHVQQGLPGTPWFRLSDQVTAREEWISLLERASAVLASFHAAVGEVPAWVGLVYPGMELRRQAMLGRFRGVSLSEVVLQRIEQFQRKRYGSSHASSPRKSSGFAASSSVQRSSARRSGSRRSSPSHWLTRQSR